MRTRVHRVDRSADPRTVPWLVGAAIVGAMLLAARATSTAASTRDVAEPMPIGLDRVGRAGAMHEVARRRPRREAGRTVIDRGHDVVEWWAMRASGLEEGIDLGRRPDGEGALRLELSTGALAAIDRGRDVALADAAGKARSRVTGLSVRESPSPSLCN